MNVVHELRLAARGLIKAPGFTLTTVTVLGLGLGLTLFMFAAVNGYILRPLPFPGAERLVHLETARPSEGRGSIEVSLHDFLDYRRDQRSLDSLAAFYAGTVNLSGDQTPERYDGAFLTANAFAVLGARPQLGRLFAEGEDQPGAAPVVILSHDLWVHRFGADPGVLGRTIRANGRPAVVVGVMPPGFHFPLNEDVWLPLSLDVSQLARGEGQTLEVFGKLRAGQSLASARHELEAIASRLAERHPDTNAGLVPVVKPYAEEFIDAGARTSIFTMFAAVVLVLLSACANVANLFLARSSARRREVAIRGALGASRRRLMLHVLSESLLVSALGGALGFWLAERAAAYAMTVIRSVETFEPPYWVTMEPDWRSFAFAAGAAFLAALVAGSVPALRAARADLVEELRQGGHGLAGAGGRLTRGFVAAQIAFSCVVLVLAGLMTRSVMALDHVALGADVSGVLSGRIGLFEAAYPTPAERVRLFERLEERLRALPGVETVSLTSSLPASFVGSRYVTPEGVEAAVAGRQPAWAHWVVASPSYFETFRVPLVAGRGFAASDREGAQPVAIVNRRFVETYWPGEDPVGKRVRFGRPGQEAEADVPWLTVVGLVPDVYQNEVDEVLRPTVYVPLAQSDPRFMSVALRGSGAPRALAEPLRRTLAALDPDLPIYWLRTAQEWVDLGRFSTRFIAALFAVFALVAMLLGAAGQYAVLAYAVSQRTREIGVRRALGARDRQLVRQLLRDGARPLAIGLGSGLALAAVFARFLSGELVGVRPFDLVTFLGVGALLGLTALVASLLPARRALRVDPLVALRSE